MEVILLEKIGRLGSMGDVVKVKNGYGRNFLIPQKKALRATEGNRKVFEARRAEIEKSNATARSAAEKEAKKFEKLSVTIVRQASEDGKLYGSVTSRDVAQALADQGHKIDRKFVILNTAIKNTGAFTAQVSLHPEVTVDIGVAVVRNESETPMSDDEQPETQAAENAAE